jgi:hypothetical protein
MQNTYVQKHIPDWDGDFYDPKNPAFANKKKEADSGGGNAGESGGFEIAEGMQIRFKKGIMKLVGTITAIDETQGVISVKTEDDKIHEISGDQVLEQIQEAAV